MKSGMIIELDGLGKVQVIGELELGDIWGLGLSDKRTTIMNPDPELSSKVLAECERVSKLGITYSSKLDDMDLSKRLDWIKDSQEKYIGEHVDVTV